MQRALEAGVGKMIQADIDSRERPDMWTVGNRYPGVLFQMLGVYPGSLNADNWQDELDQVHRIAAQGYYSPLQEKVVDQVQGKIGRGLISSAGPSPAIMPLNTLEARCGGPGPGDRIEPRPKSSWTWSTESLTGTTEAWTRSTEDGETTRVGNPIVAIGEVGLDYHEGKEFAEIPQSCHRLPPPARHSQYHNNDIHP